MRCIASNSYKGIMAAFLFLLLISPIHSRRISGHPLQTGIEGMDAGIEGWRPPLHGHRRLGRFAMPPPSPEANGNIPGGNQPQGSRGH